MSAANKAIVRSFNHQVIEHCSHEAFEALVAEDFINHSAAPGQPQGREGLWHTFCHVLHPGLS